MSAEDNGNQAEPTLPTRDPAVCPVCSQTWEPLPFSRERRSLYSHLRAEHGWTAEQVDELRGKKPALAKPKPEGTVRRPPASPKAPTSRPVKPASEFAKRLQRMAEVQPKLASAGNTMLLQGTIALGWFPPMLLVEFRSDPQTGMPLPMWDRPTEFGRAVMLDDREVMVLAAGWAFSEDTTLSAWLETHLMTVAPPVVALACAVVAFKHLATLRQLAKSPAVTAFKDQLNAAVAQMKRQAEAQAQAAEHQAPPSA